MRLPGAPRHVASDAGRTAPAFPVHWVLWFSPGTHGPGGWCLRDPVDAHPEIPGRGPRRLCLIDGQGWQAVVYKTARGATFM